MASDAKTRILRWIEKQGVRPCCDPEWTGKLLECVMSVGDVFPDLVRLVSVWYTFNIEEQKYTDEAAGADGICWIDVTNDIGTLYAVGISCEALEVGLEYSQMVILHELAHMLTGEAHSIRFHETLSDMINKFNSATGSGISNDFYGIKTRYDSRPWGLPDDIPKQQSRRGSAFRTEAKR